MSASRCSVVFTLMSVAGSDACGVLRPQPRWSNRTVAVAVRVDAAHPDRAARPGAAVHDERGLAVGVAALLPVDAVAVADVEHPVGVRLDRREGRGHANPDPSGRRGRPLAAGRAGQAASAASRVRRCSSARRRSATHAACETPSARAISGCVRSNSKRRRRPRAHASRAPRRGTRGPRPARPARTAAPRSRGAPCGRDGGRRRARTGRRARRREYADPARSASSTAASPHSSAARELVHRRGTPELPRELRGRPPRPQRAILQVARDVERPRLVAQVALQRADHRRDRVARERHAAVGVETVDRLDQREARDLEEILRGRPDPSKRVVTCRASGR